VWSGGTVIEISDELGLYKTNIWDHAARRYRFPRTSIGMDKALRDWAATAEPRRRIVSGTVTMTETCGF
jgi:hypothetical protein